MIANFDSLSSSDYFPLIYYSSFANEYMLMSSVADPDPDPGLNK
jgi:hypothetical protein